MSDNVSTPLPLLALNYSNVFGQKLDTICTYGRKYDKRLIVTVQGSGEIKIDLNAYDVYLLGNEVVYQRRADGIPTDGIKHAAGFIPANAITHVHLAAM